MSDARRTLAHGPHGRLGARKDFDKKFVLLTGPLAVAVALAQNETTTAAAGNTTAKASAAGVTASISAVAALAAARML